MFMHKRKRDEATEVTYTREFNKIEREIEQICNNERWNTDLHIRWFIHGDLHDLIAHIRHENEYSELNELDRDGIATVNSRAPRYRENSPKKKET